MSNAEIFKSDLLKIMANYPIDSETGSISIRTMANRSLAQAAFLRENKESIEKMGRNLLDQGLLLEDVQRVLYKTMNEHFRVGRMEQS